MVLVEVGFSDLVEALKEKGKRTHSVEVNICISLWELLFWIFERLILKVNYDRKNILEGVRYLINKGFFSFKFGAR